MGAKIKTRKPILINKEKLLELLLEDELKTIKPRDRSIVPRTRLISIAKDKIAEGVQMLIFLEGNIYALKILNEIYQTVYNLPENQPKATEEVKVKTIGR